MILLLLILVFITNTDGCIRSKDAEYAHSSVVRITCPRDIVRTADYSSTSTTVSWDRHDFRLESSHPIKAVYQTIPIYGASAEVTKSFSEGQHLIEYKAVDEAGVIDSCSFLVSISVIRCDRLFNPNPHVGRLTCDAAFIYGSKCRLSCYEGYTVVGSSDTIECGPDGHWSGDIPFCQIKTCPDPGTPIHGTRFCTTVNHAFGSFCTFSCNRGYQLVGKDKLFCGSNEGSTFWSSDTPICEEIQPPKVEICPADQTIQTSETTTEIQKPRTLFRTASGKEAPHVCSHFGEYTKHNFTLGIHIVTCTAFDPVFGDKATATCQFTIHIKANPCQQLNKPLHGTLLCSRAHGGGTARHDTSCTLHCDQGYTLGRDAAQGTATFVCDSSGNWLPSNIVPSCVRPKRPQEVKLPSEILYSSTNCGNSAHLRALEIKFQSAVQTAIRLGSTSVCATNPGDCIVDEVNSECRNFSARFRRHITRLERRYRLKHAAYGRRYSHRRSVSKRSIDQPKILPVQFHFGTRVPETSGQWPDEYVDAARRLYGMFHSFETQLLRGDFSIKDKVTDLHVDELRDSLTYNSEIAICDIGYKFAWNIKLCVPCGAGTHYNIEQETCVLCPASTYQDHEAQFRCKQCPPGSATIDAGATSINQCVDIEECLSDPCMHNGVCQDGVSTYTCKCQSGYSGENCEEIVYDCLEHACLNGGTCIPEGQSNYTCQCRSHYFGEYCQLHSVDGGWSDWTKWSSCSKSCEGGVTSRSRSCNSPPPSEDGKICEGATIEEKVCNLYECPACKRLRRPYQGTMTCNRYDEEDLLSCIVGCPGGYAFSGPVFPVYVCGRNTSYLWPHESPDNPRCVIPACTKLTQPTEIKYEFQTALQMVCSEKQRFSSDLTEEIHDKAREVTQSLHCIQKGTCSLDPPEIICCPDDMRSKREDGWLYHRIGARKCEDNPTVTRSRRSISDDEAHSLNTTKLDGAENDIMNNRGMGNETGEAGIAIDEEVEIKVVLVYHGSGGSNGENDDKPSLLAGVDDTTEELYDLGQNLLNQSRSGHLFVKFNGKHVQIDSTRTTGFNRPMCSVGHMPSNEGYHCVECSPGTYYHALYETCVLCEVGFYQSYPARSECHQCPHNQTTYGRGAILRAECYHEGMSPPYIPDDEYERLELAQESVALYHIIPITVIAILVILTCLVIIIIIIRKKREFDHRKEERQRTEDEGPQAVDNLLE